MNELQVFNYESNEVRTVMIDGEPWFVGKDVALALGYKDTVSALKAHVDHDDKRGWRITTPSGIQEMTIINESGVYSLIFSSKLPDARKFKRWVTSQVLPSVRRTGTYSTGNALPNTKAALAEAKLNNSRARKASVWLKLAQTNPIPTFQQICAHYASAELTGGEAVLPLPEVKERTYSAEEVGMMLGGVSANKVGRIANKNGLKAPEYGVEVWDKSKHSAKQVPVWRYNDRAVERFREIMREEDVV